MYIYIHIYTHMYETNHSHKNQDLKAKLLSRIVRVFSGGGGVCSPLCFDSGGSEELLGKVWG